MFGSASRFFNIAPTISLPIFYGGRLRADLDARDADYDLAVAQYNKTLVQALGDIGNTLSQLRETGRQIQAQQHQPICPAAPTTRCFSGTAPGVRTTPGYSATASGNSNCLDGSASAGDC